MARFTETEVNEFISQFEKLEKSLEKVGLVASFNESGADMGIFNIKIQGRMHPDATDSPLAFTQSSGNREHLMNIPFNREVLAKMVAETGFPGLEHKYEVLSRWDCISEINYLVLENGN